MRSEVASADSKIYSEIEQTASSIRSRVTSVETGLHTEILQTACMIMSIVGPKGRNYFQYSDPSGENEIQEGDIWVKTTGVTSHQAASELTHEELGEYKWAEFYGNEIYMWKGEGDAGHWEKIGGDQLSEITHTRIEQTDERIALITDSMGGDYAEFIVEIGRIRSRVQDVEAGLESTIEQTASMIRSAVFTANSEMYSEILQTQSMIRHLVGDYDAEGGLYSLIQQLAGQIRSEVSVKANIYVMWANPASSGYDVKDGDMWVKYFDAVSHAAAGEYSHNQLAEHDWKDFYGHEIYMRKGGAWTKVGGNQLEEMEHTMIEQTDEHVRILAEDMAGHYAEFKVEKDQIRSIVADKERKLETTITQTAEEVRIDAYNSSSTMFGQLSVRADKIEGRVGDTETGLSTLTLTVEGISTDVTTLDGRYSSLKQTVDGITTKVGKLEGDYSQIKQTATSIEAEVTAARGGKASLKIRVDEISSKVTTIEGDYSSISQTATKISAAVESAKSDLRSEIKVESDRIDLVVSGTGSNAKIKPAKIVESINGGASTILLSADHIKLDAGTTKLSDVLTISDGGALFSKMALFRIGTHTITLNNGKLTAETVQPTTLKFAKNVQDQYYNITSAVLGGMVKTVEVTGNTLKITKFDDTVINFSKATTLSGSWSGGTYKATAKQNGTTVGSESTTLGGLSGTGDVTKSGKNVSRKMRVQYIGSSENLLNTGAELTATIDASGVYDDGWTGCYNTIKLNQTSRIIGRGTSIRICPQAKASPTADVADVGSQYITITAASGVGVTMTRGAYDPNSRTYTCTCQVNSQIATAATFYLYAF